MQKLFTALLVCLIFFGNEALAQQNILEGVIKDRETNETLIGASVVIKGTTFGATTDINGKFRIDLGNRKLPLVVIVSYIGYEQQELNITDNSKPLQIRLKQSQQTLKGVDVIDSRISQKQKEAALTVEAMDMIAIKETPAPSFYQGLGTLKGVDLTTASLGFVVINTRGFNSTSPVRSLQLIDGVDNQSPGLNFSLGNFLGAPDLDVQKVELIAGASSAFFGPNAFNGVINMTTISPFTKEGVSASVKVGERALTETAFRIAKVWKDEDGLNKYGFKLNFSYFRAYDWEATNLNPTEQSVGQQGDPGGYDAVNRYGDERLFEINLPISHPGLYRFYRTGYEEKDIVDYNTRNLKTGAAFHYMMKPNVEFIAASNFGTGTTVYQGDNRFSLKDVLFFQNRLEIRKKDKWFIRTYATNEDAGKSYDAVFTALLLQRAAKDDIAWFDNYIGYWQNTIRPELNNPNLYPGFPKVGDFGSDIVAYRNAVQNFYNQNPDIMRNLYDRARNRADSMGAFNPNNPTFNRFEPGTAAFDSAFNETITRTSFTEGGSRFFDRSALYHTQAEYIFDTTRVGVFRMGGNIRFYRPNSQGTIFSDTNGVVITNREFGIYGGWEKKFIDNKLTASFTIRLDKNQNFNYLASPAASLVYNLKKDHVLRFSLSSAIRNPTLADQFLYYNVGTARLIGNLNGFDSLVNVESFIDYLNTRNIDSLQYFNIAPIRPEQVRTFELGYRGTLWNKLYVDAGYYFSFYQDFIGFNLGVTFDDARDFGLPATNIQAYRVAANATDIVTTQGFAIGLNYYFHKKYALNGNYSWNRLDLRGSDDPIIPAFNTPEHKFNIGVSARELVMDFRTFAINNIGFNINYKWIQGFQFEGSPQFTGFVPTYGLIDAQVNYTQEDWKTTFKLGASNLLNNQVFQVYGGPVVGRLAYFSVVYDFVKK